MYEDQTEAESARMLCISVGTVESQCARALQTLRSRMTAAAPVDIRVEAVGLAGIDV